MFNYPRALGSLGKIPGIFPEGRNGPPDPSRGQVASSSPPGLAFFRFVSAYQCI